ncbi:putative 2-oxoglutarate/Fe(II)-dependent dioxygenase YbiX/peroxiredoxin [Nitrobacteraceae bacterium AZCC 1564]
MTPIKPLSAGEPAPWFSAATGNTSEKVAFDELAGRHIVLFFFGSARGPEIAKTLVTFGRHNDLFDHKRALFLGVSNDPDDFHHGRVHQRPPGQLFVLDTDALVARHYGLADPEPAATHIRPTAFILSPTLQILEIVPFTEPAAFTERVIALLREYLPRPSRAGNAPVLHVPNVFDRAFCRELVSLYEAAGGREIGAIEKEGKIVEKFDPAFRKRLDYFISDATALQRTRDLLERRLLPMVYRAFQFSTTRIERYLVGRYDAETGGHFRPHRDNTAPVVAHRRFAVTINLNEGYEGGDLRFPEFGSETYRAPPGDAIVFSCSLLHEVTPVTRDHRYAFISFFYDERSQQMREAYMKSMAQTQTPTYV